MTHARPRQSTDVQAVYDAEYFRAQVDGAEGWAGFTGDPATLYPRARRNLELLNVKAGERMLELGCGRGEAALAAAWLGASVVAVDFAEPALAMARERQREIESATGRRLDAQFVQASATTMELPADSIDRVLMSEFIEHVSADEADRILRAVHGWLRPGGTLLVYTYPNRLARRFWPVKRLLYRLFRGEQLPTQMPDTIHPHYRDYHLNEQSLHSLRGTLRRSGFKGRVWFDSQRARRNAVIEAALRPWRLVTDMNLTAWVQRA